MNWKKFFQERQATLASGVAALVIIAIGFLLFNNANQNNVETKKSNDLAAVSTQSAEKKTQLSAPEKKSTDSAKKTETKTINVTYHVARGDSLSSIAQKFYGDKNKWTLIANENHLANPSLIHVGNVLTIPDTTTTNSVDQNQNAQKTPPNPTKEVKSYTVVRGDNLWTLSEKFYGSGYSWYKIANANKDKIGLTSNGKPLLRVGTVLTIPST